MTETYEGYRSGMITPGRVTFFPSKIIGMDSTREQNMHVSGLWRAGMVKTQGR
ncbi:uncharacterized protein STEHIDRAFT_145988 [Stereum hirsutum FP-91666 SS1]|uniref:uncharacterized protein n=1 Tax=Stereum hirsutum (strain FP-91666) TaxID=721885 RepID=UPI000440ED80|nr:uncharacterized protein STEHIDRAFT_145988 [Stereum hirsutum FP-91666 SS1]EIM87731.1 hypothetical protein STEHIDRAFT_145988 [Stereum hirsutum FP-91666 SS1]